MKLFANPASPFVRKVRVTAAEHGLADRIEIVTAVVSPVKPLDELNRANPLGKIPALQLDNGEVLFDSRVICDYLLSLASEAPPRSWSARTQEALADGVLDAAVAMRYETALRPEGLRWPLWIGGQESKILRALDVLDAAVVSWGSIDNRTLTLAEIGTACALGYLDFRNPDLGWRDGRASLNDWFDTVSQRRSLRDSEPA